MAPMRQQSGSSGYFGTIPPPVSCATPMRVMKLRSTARANRGCAYRPSSVTESSKGENLMKRRHFLATAGIGAAATTLAAPAIAQDVHRWQLVSAWPRNLPGPGVAAQALADRITALSGGRIEVELFAAGEIVPGMGVFDAVAEGTAQIYHAVPSYWGSKSNGIMLFGSQAFGLTAPEQIGWLMQGGGQDLYDEMYARFNLKPFLCGNSGPQWAGWFRDEIHTVDDLRGLKFRSTGLASEMYSRLGMAVQAAS